MCHHLKNLPEVVIRLFEGIVGFVNMNKRIPDWALIYSEISLILILERNLITITSFF